MAQRIPTQRHASVASGATCNSPPSNGWQYPRLDEGQVLNTRRAAVRQSGHFNFGLTRAVRGLAFPPLQSLC